MPDGLRRTVNGSDVTKSAGHPGLGQVLHLFELEEGVIPLPAGLLIGTRTLRVKVAGVAGGGCQCFAGAVDRLIDRVILIRQRFSVSPVQMDRWQGVSESGSGHRELGL